MNGSNLFERLRQTPPPDGRGAGDGSAVVQLSRGIARDVEHLLNTRSLGADALPRHFDELRPSLLCYGLPDFTALSALSDRDREFMRVAIEQAIATHEPRLKQVRVSANTPSADRPQLVFTVEALLVIKPHRERVRFDAALRPTSNTYAVSTR